MFDLQRARRLAASTHDAAKLARRLEDACDEIARLRDELAKAGNFASSASKIAHRALTSTPEPNAQARNRLEDA